MGAGAGESSSLHGRRRRRSWTRPAPLETALDVRPATPRPGLRPLAALLLVLLGLALHAGALRGPFTDGQAGNCGAMFAIFARNEHALGGLLATHGVPIVNPVPPASLDGAEFYTHHPPGLPWAVMLAGRLPIAIETAGRLVALLATLATALLLADLAARLAGWRAALAAGTFALALPAGLHDGLLVNYETVAIPAALLLFRALLLDEGRPAAAGLIAALADWVALLPLALCWRGSRRSRWLAAASAAALVLVLWIVLAGEVAPASGAETLAQAVGTSVLARDFSWGEWAAAVGRHLWTLFGAALLVAAAGLVAALARGASRLAGLLLRLLAFGGLNLLLFARHATGHEHYALLLLPFVALAAATALFPRDEAARPPAGLGALLAGALLLLGGQQYREAAPPRSAVGQAELADAFRAVTSTDELYLRPAGASFVFLHRAGRHVSPTPVGSVEAARAAADALRARFELGARPAFVVLARDEAVPGWLAGLGPPQARGELRLFPL